MGGGDPQFLIKFLRGLETRSTRGVTQEQVRCEYKSRGLIDVLKASAYSRIVGRWGGQYNSIGHLWKVIPDD